MDTVPRATTFIIRLLHEPSGHVSGVVERVRTGVKERFEGRDALCRLIAAMVESDREVAEDGRGAAERS